MSIDTTAPLVLRENTGGLATLRLNRPLQFNALSEAMLAALQAELDIIAGQPEVRCVVLAAEGKAFCAGHDLREMQATRKLDYYKALFAQCSRVMRWIQELPVPVIARVHGIATAAGFAQVGLVQRNMAARTGFFRMRQPVRLQGAGLLPLQEIEAVLPRLFNQRTQLGRGQGGNG